MGSLGWGACPAMDITRRVGLWPKTPLKRDGIRIDPATSDPTPKTEAPAPRRAPCKVRKNHQDKLIERKDFVKLTSPPEDPPEVLCEL